MCRRVPYFKLGSMNTTHTESFWSPLVLRVGVAGDEPALRELAELDSAPAPAGTVLLAELGGRLVAARSLDDDQAITDPFVPSVEILELLRIRAEQLTPRPASPASFGMLRPRRTPLVRSLRLIWR